ncbi:hypothetical protein EJ04DRAFT_575030 [Polyplosphaeria fusca]|uniref:Uncharacterized protein n=1 Tax=Polyplosphaeria fusca TaxID=682080 RepID=A0A9P4R4R4_9PLEO|nr:hypothetical protein EJ04DRAFT_575030 [Polyplosphaeria fusca]
MPSSLIHIARSVQRGSQRFLDPELDQPRLKAWRCELTALSHVYNLYFIAYGQEIWIFQPVFPEQRLPEKPALILRPPVSSANLDFVLDPECPHSINRLLVDFLGRDEILLVGCDDGDVIGYRVYDIQRAIEKTTQEKDRECQVRVFLHRNVQKSAWGLAVHREARLIAISANTHEITVIAYALADPERKVEPDANRTLELQPLTAEFASTDGTGSDSGPHTPNSSRQSIDSSLALQLPRHTDRTITLISGSNVPSVSFNNNGSDPTGRWLFGSSIDGKTTLWDLHDPDDPTRTFQLGRCVGASNPKRAPVDAECTCSDRHHIPHAAWDALFIDPRACRSATSQVEAFGAEIAERRPQFWDITSSKPRVSERARQDIYLGLDTASEDSGEDMALDEAEDEQQTETGHNVQTIPMNAEDHDDYETMMALSYIQQTSMGVHLAWQMGDVEMDDESDTESVGGEDIFAPSSAGEDSPPATDAGADDEEEEDSGVFGPAFVAEDEPSESDGSDDEAQPMLNLPAGAAGAIWIDSNADMTHITHAPRTEKSSYFELDAEHNPDLLTLSGPALIVTKQDVYMLQPHTLSDPSPPTPDHPTIALQLPHLALGAEPFAPPHDRLCYSTQIPELGIALVASPAGKLAVLDLTALVRKESEEPEEKIVYGFKLATVLPEKEVEQRWGFLAYVRLVGVAVGPVQGMLDGEWDAWSGRMRRWRVLMMYQDHSVVCYELSRRREKGGVNLEALVV